MFYGEGFSLEEDQCRHCGRALGCKEATDIKWARVNIYWGDDPALLPEYLTSKYEEIRTLARAKFLEVYDDSRRTTKVAGRST